MSGITSGVGIFSGIDTGQLIEQLLSIEARPKTLAQNRVVQIQTQQAALLDINSRLQALQTAAANFRTGDIFGTVSATSTKPDTLAATASAGAAAGTYSFIVDRLVSTQQLYSKGFGDRDATPLGAESFTFEGAEARLDRDTALSELNGGAGIKRGGIVVTDSSGAKATIDLSKAVNVSDVLEAFNSNDTISVKAEVSGGSFRLTDLAGGGGSLLVQNAAGSTTAQSLGIAGTAVGGVIDGARVHELHAGTSLSTLNDGNGVEVSTTIGTAAYDFTIQVDSTSVNINLGDIYEFSGGSFNLVDPRVTTVGGAIERINETLAAQGITDVTAAIAPDGERLQLVDATGAHAITVSENNKRTAATLGLLTDGPVTGTVTGGKVLAGLNSTLVKNLGGGDGELGDGFLSFSLHDGSSFSLTVDTDATVQEMIAQIQAEADASLGAGKFQIALSSVGTGLQVADLTSGSNNLIIGGTGSGDTNTAEALSIATDPAGTTAASVDSGNLQHRYISRATLVSKLNGGAGIGTGKFRITDASGQIAEVDIGSDSKNIGSIIDEINTKPIGVKARINANGDGIELYDSVGSGSLNIKVEEVSGTVASKLNIKGTSSGTGAENVIDGSFERTVTFEASDTLDQIATKINEAAIGVKASIINDGTGASPFHMSLVSTSSGKAGRFVLDTGSFELGAQTLDKGENSVVFYGSSDPAKGVLLTGSSNTLDSVIPGVTLDLKGVSQSPTTVTISKDIDAVASKVETFLETFNTAITRIDFQTRYDQETEVKGALLGDSTLLNLRSTLFNTILGPSLNTSGEFNRLVDVGVKIGDGGKLTLNKERFREAMEADPEGVKALFTDRATQSNVTQQPIPGNPNIIATIPTAKDTFTSLGFGGLIEELSKSYINSVDGILTVKSRTYDDQITLQQGRIEQFNVQLESKRTILQQQFLAMEQSIAQLQSQQSSLSQIQLVG